LVWALSCKGRSLYLPEATGDSAGRHLAIHLGLCWHLDCNQAPWGHREVIFCVPPADECTFVDTLHPEEQHLHASANRPANTPDFNVALSLSTQMLAHKAPCVSLCWPLCVRQLCQLAHHNGCQAGIECLQTVSRTSQCTSYTRGTHLAAVSLITLLNQQVGASAAACSFGPCRNACSGRWAHGDS
jgi:hypothetical protein